MDKRSNTFHNINVNVKKLDEKQGDRGYLEKQGQLLLRNSRLAGKSAMSSCGRFEFSIIFGKFVLFGKQMLIRVRVIIDEQSHEIIQEYLGFFPTS